MDKSIFSDKKKIPNDKDLVEALGNTYPLWQTIKDYVSRKYPDALEEWKYPGDKYGWNFRMKDKKRTIIYFLPRDAFFKVAFVFGQKATETIAKSRISSAIKRDLASARAYAEGRGIRIDVKDEMIIKNIKELVDIKLGS